MGRCRLGGGVIGCDEVGGRNLYVCTHELSLGRTEFYRHKRKGGRGSLPSGEMGVKRPVNSELRMLVVVTASDAVACVSGAVGSNQSRIGKFFDMLERRGRGILAEGMLWARKDLRGQSSVFVNTSGVWRVVS